MCRIAGFIDPSVKNLQEEILHMRDSMQHGGPDDEGVYTDSSHHLALGHRRLALIDLSAAGHQPMTDDGLQVIYNGEIYNFKELKSILINAGYQFHSNSDTEVILKAYRHWGTDCFSLFDGMFALVIWDEAKKQLILARDHAGIKPLYYYADANRFYFASEIRAFSSLSISFSENPEWKTYFLLFGHLPEPVTTLKNVIPLEKGTVLTVQLPGLQLQKKNFYQVSFNDKIKIEKDAVALVRTKLEEAVYRHLISDAPIGLFLSGGIDSSLLTLIASKIHSGDLYTLSIIFDEKEFSEEYFQKIIIAKTGVKHHSFLVTQQTFEENLPDVMKAMDQPTVDGINTYFISKYTKEYGLKAVLSGLGADEIFGGYPSFRFSSKYSWIKKIPSGLLNVFQTSDDHRLRKLSFASLKNTLGEYLVYRGIFTPRMIASLTQESESAVVSSIRTLNEKYEQPVLKNGNRVSYLETNLYMQNQLLRDTDFMSMWHSIEIRVPFLDKFLLNAAAQIDPVIKYNKSLPKYLLIKAFEKELPAEIWKRKKQGFTFPFEKWMQQSSYIQPRNSKEEALFASFKKNNLSWSRYWCALLMNRFGKEAV